MSTVEELENEDAFFAGVVRFEGVNLGGLNEHVVVGVVLYIALKEESMVVAAIVLSYPCALFQVPFRQVCIIQFLLVIFSVQNGTIDSR